MDTQSTSPQPARVSATAQGNVLRVRLEGSWSMSSPWPREAADLLRSLRAEAQSSLSLSGRPKEIFIECSSLGSWDTSLLCFVKELHEAAQEKDIEVSRSLPEALERLVALAFAVKKKEGSGKVASEEGALDRIGGAVLEIPSKVVAACDFVGGVVIAFGRLLRGKSTMRSKDMFDAMHECSIQSLGIVAVTNLLFGLILAFVGAVQLTTFGAQIYVAGLVGIGTLRVMGAVMVGIVMAGRIGAAYAALIGTMQVNEEIDALETMGVSPTEYLVLPRVIALSCMVPMLTLFADLMGLIGGYMVGTLVLDLSPTEYVYATMNMVTFKQLVIGLIYSGAFGVIIALCGCYQGMRCGRSAQAVGLATTTAVVHSLVGIILATAVITVVFNALHI